MTIMAYPKRPGVVFFTDLSQRILRGQSSGLFGTWTRKISQLLLGKVPHMYQAMYRPKFCAECGDKIIRLRWHLWHSRKFCERCAPRFRKEQAIRVASAGVAVLVLGIAIGRAARPATPPLVIQRNRDQRLPGQPANAASTASANATLTEEVYLCGARTKKGTPCSRRVHGLVRCWQHKGMPAMLAPDKLRIKE